MIIKRNIQLMAVLKLGFAIRLIARRISDSNPSVC